MLRGHRESLWWSQLPASERTLVRAPLAGDRDTDVCIVGAGYTGLWTAHALLRADPSIRVMVVEAAVAGAGASSRNGGWCSTLLPVGWETVAAGHGRAAALAWQNALDATLDEIAAIDCRFHRGGFLQTASNPAQLARLRAQLEHGLAWDRPLQWLTAAQARQRIDAAPVLGAVFDPRCAVVQPALLVRGLARAVEALGGVIHEATRVATASPGRVVTNRGVVRADVVVQATEAYTPGRALLPIYSSMIATQPLNAQLWSALGWRGREAFMDGRRHLFYAQRTADDRIAFGGRGAPYRFGSRIDDPTRALDTVAAGLRAALVEQFPALAGVAVTHRWGGVLGVPRDFMPAVRFDRRTGLAFAGGYTGDGVALSNLAGRTMADLILGAESALVGLPWVNRPVRRWEPEPLRWVGTRVVEVGAAAADRSEARDLPVVARAFDTLFRR